jgi:hypothetical protein
VQITRGEAVSEIPDWLVELAAQQGDNDEEEAGESEWDFFQVEPAENSRPEPSFGQSPFSESAAPSQAPVVVDVAEDDDLMANLRSQVESVEPEELPARRTTKSALDYRIAGLRPWQQLVLSVLLFLDVGIIGLLFLVMLGRIALP